MSSWCCRVQIEGWGRPLSPREKVLNELSKRLSTLVAEMGRRVCSGSGWGGFMGLSDGLYVFRGHMNWDPRPRP
jgi:hypothetical protein